MESTPFPVAFPILRKNRSRRVGSIGSKQLPSCSLKSRIRSRVLAKSSSNEACVNSGSNGVSNEAPLSHQRSAHAVRFSAMYSAGSAMTSFFFTSCMKPVNSSLIHLKSLPTFLVAISDIHCWNPLIACLKSREAALLSIISATVRSPSTSAIPRLLIPLRAPAK